MPDVSISLDARASSVRPDVLQRKDAWRAAALVLGEAAADLQEHMDLAAERGLRVAYEPAVIDAIIEGARHRVIDSADYRPGPLSWVEIGHELVGGELRLWAKLNWRATHHWVVKEQL